MRLPRILEFSDEESVTTRFLGVNYSDASSEEELTDAENLSTRAFPLIAPRRARQLVHKLTAPQGMIAHEKLFFIDDGNLYWGGVKIEGASVSQGEKTLAAIGAYIAIFPDKVLFNTQTLSLEPMENRVQTQGNATVSLCADAGGGAFSAVPISSDAAPQEPADGALWIDTSDSVSVLKKWSSQSGMWIAVTQTYVKIAAAGIGAGFSQYDGVTIEGAGALDGDYSLEGCKKDFIVVTALIDAPYQTEGAVTVARRVPDLSLVLGFENRLWGCSADGHTIYASKLGDAKNWNCFMGLASDSYAMTIGAPGPFTGCASHMGSVLFLKRDALFRIYGTKPSNFQLNVLTARGASKGSRKSCAVLNETLYYLSDEGPLCCDGGLPAPFSRALSALRLKNGCAAAHMGRWYLSCEDANGDWQLFVYDEGLGLWQREDNTHARCFASCGEGLYFIDDDKNLVLIGGESPYQFPDTAAEQTVAWRARTGQIGLCDTKHQRVRRVCVRGQLMRGSSLRVYARFDADEDWKLVSSHSHTGLFTASIPIRSRRAQTLTLEFRGTNDARIYAVSRIRDRESERGGA